MPKRSNDFQTLILLIKAQLAPEGVRVSESKTLPDLRTGKKREVDIVLECDAVGHRVLVGIECTKTRRPATIEWVERMAGKHEHLPTDKLILISRSGFARDALKEAKLRGIEAMTVEEASKADWRNTMKLKEIILRHQRYYPSDFHLHLADDAAAAELRGAKIGDLMLHVGGSQRAIPMSQPIDQALAHPDVRRGVDEDGVDPNQWQLPVEVKFDAGTFIRGLSGSEVGVLSLKFTVRYRQSDTNVRLQYGALAGTNVAFGTANTKAGQMVVSIVEGDKDRTTMALKVVSGSENADTGKFMEVKKGKFIADDS